MREDLVSEKEEIKCKTIQKMINFDNVTKENIKENYCDHPYRICIIAGSGSGKTYSLFNPKISNQILIKFI